MPSTAKDEALNASATFDFEGQSYTVEPSSLKDLDVLEAFEDGKLITAVRGLLGPAQWRTFRATGADAEALGRMIEHLEQAFGLSGN